MVSIFVGVYYIYPYILNINLLKKTKSGRNNFLPLLFSKMKQI